MNRKSPAILALLGSLLVGAAHPIAIERKPVSFKGSFEGGIIQSLEHALSGIRYENLVLNRIGVWVNDQTVVDGRLRFDLGLGGILFYPFPENPALPFTKQRMFLFGISQVSLGYAFGFLENPYLKATLGQFPFKYNPDAVNLGEYLFRSRAYPLIVQTGGYMVAENAQASLLGLDLSNRILDGMITNNLLVTSETGMTPLYDLSLTWLSTLRLGKALELGGGVTLDRLIPGKPSRTTPKNQSYFHWKGDSLAPAGDYWIQDPNPGVQAIVADTALVNTLDLKYYTYKSTKLMGRASIDFKPLFGLEGGRLGKDDLKIFGEAALLGVKNYPFFYEKRQDRMPVMMGVNLPAFGLVDLVSVQAEHLSYSFANDWYGQLQFDNPLPRTQNWKPDSIGHKDDWRWSVFAKKSFARGVEVVIQAASDHLRPIDANYNLEARTVLLDPRKDFYYMTKLTWGF